MLPEPVFKKQQTLLVLTLILSYSEKVHLQNHLTETINWFLFSHFSECEIFQTTKIAKLSYFN